MVFLGIYNFAFRKNKPIVEVKESKSVEKNNNASLETATSIKIPKIIAVSDRGVIGAAYDKKNDSLLYYSALDGTTWKSDADGKNKQQISNVKITGLKNVIWSPDKSKVLTTLNKDETDLFYEYDTVLKKAVKLKDGLDTVVWDNMSSKILYKYYDQLSKERTLNIANPDGTGWQKLADVNFRNISISQIPMTSIVSFWNYPAASEETLLQIVGISGGEINAIFKGRFGADYLWSPDGSIALVSSLSEINEKNISLGTVDLKGIYTELNVPTMVSKCVWSSNNNTVYYALAGGIPNNAVIPDDYLSGKINTKDTFWKMDIETGKKERIIEPNEMEGNFDASNMFLSPTEDALYFVNRVDKKLYKIEL